jgi:hypothetical protein
VFEVGEHECGFDDVADLARAGGRELDANTRTYNALLRGLRCLGERGFALLVGRWRALRHMAVAWLLDRSEHADPAPS